MWFELIENGDVKKIEVNGNSLRIETEDGLTYQSYKETSLTEELANLGLSGEQIRQANANSG